MVGYSKFWGMLYKIWKIKNETINTLTADVYFEVFFSQNSIKVDIFQDVT